MRRWIWTGAIVALVLLMGLLVWQLDIPNWQQLDLERIRTRPESTTIFDAQGARVGALSAVQPRSSVRLGEVPEDVVQAFLTAEDQRFYSHSGVDVKRIFGALWHDLTTLSLEQGASTITQQLIKLTHLSSEKTLSRKVQEAYLARQLERVMTKDEILEAYLNTVYFGNGAYGIGSAARAYFGKDVEELSLVEGALLAGVIKSPTNYAPHLNPENALARRDRILDAMLASGTISDAACAAAKSEPLNLKLAEPEQSANSWYMDLVLEEAMDVLDMDAEDILSGGLHIYTALDVSLQASADALFENGANFPDPAADGTPVQAAMIAMNTADGEIAAVVGGREYEVQRGLNRATQIQRQPGSAIKPVSTYAAAIENYNFLPSSMVQDVQREFAGKYLPGNVGGNYYGTVTLREALSRSLNVATVDLADLIGIQSVRNAIASFGIPLAAQDVNLSLALGYMTYGVSPARLCAAYCALANGGTRVEPHAIRRITDPNGKLLYEVATPSEAAVSPQTAFLVTDMLQTAATSGSAKALSSIGVPVAGKTGTVGEAEGGNRDIWTVGYTPELAVAVWMGYDSPGDGHAMPDYAGGSSYPAQLCAAMLSAARLSGAPFDAPEGLVPAKIDREALNQYDQVLLAAANTPEAYVQTEWFRDGQLPTETSSLWDAPQMVDDLTLLNAEDGTPALAFTARDSTAEYLILRKTDAGSEVAAVLSAEAGSVIVWADPDSAGTACRYSVLPRHKLLYESGTLLTGMESAEVRYSPGGLLGHILG
ncbi:MAG: PBP1A family penicillin-binding protein [Clostridia bacterium]|nr:PBP1A family penicillin-binding protein [Clostridia bacterium]